MSDACFGCGLMSGQAAGSVDVILSTVPSGTDLDDYLSLLTPNGAMVCVGLPPKDPAHRAGVYMQSLGTATSTLFRGHSHPPTAH